MARVLIRDLDEDVVTAYREEAARNRRSLESTLRELITRHRPMSAKERSAALERFAEIRAMTPDVPQTPSEVLVRRMRDGADG